MPSKFVLFWFVNAGLIRAEENRILFEMCQTISQNRAEIRQAVTAIAEIDVFRAKAKVGARMRGIIPEVRTSFHVTRQTLTLFFCPVFSILCLTGVSPVLDFIQTSDLLLLDFLDVSYERMSSCDMYHAKCCGCLNSLASVSYC